MKRVRVILLILAIIAWVVSVFAWYEGDHIPSIEEIEYAKLMYQIAFVSAMVAIILSVIFAYSIFYWYSKRETDKELRRQQQKNRARALGLLSDYEGGFTPHKSDE